MVVEKELIKLCVFIVMGLILYACSGQVEYKETQGSSNNIGPVGGGCDGCELMYADMPNAIPAIDTSTAWDSGAEKLLISGKTLELDGTTEASGVIIYYWHTDANGYYSAGKGESERHGRIRGWVKSDNNGNYAIYTSKPGAYPNTGFPAHVHLSIKEPDIDQEYYIDDLVFDDDPLLTADKRKQKKNRGGSGVLTLFQHNDILRAKRNIILGLNIPNYPIDKHEEK